MKTLDQTVAITSGKAVECTVDDPSTGSTGISGIFLVA